MFVEKYKKRAEATNSLVCVGLDSDFGKLPSQFTNFQTPQFDFNKAIIDATHEFVAAYKPNVAFYEARGDQGLRELKLTMEYLQTNHPDIPTILDAKRADIGNTNQGYVQSIFDWLGFDAVTLHPYLGKEALQPFLERADKGCIILCRTSNPGAGEFQDLVSNGKPLWQHVADKIANNWNSHNNCLLVVGATYPEEMVQIRQATGEMTFLVPGIGAQGGDVATVVKAGKTADGLGLIINSSRGIIFAGHDEDFADQAALAAKKLRDEINRYR
ncbi:MAG: orotidine-5'-phosphate decarboxylase [Patescibacteria group bacterium]